MKKFLLLYLCYLFLLPFGKTQDSLYQNKIQVQLYSYQQVWGSFNKILKHQDAIGISYERIRNARTLSTLGFHYNRTEVDDACNNCFSSPSLGTAIQKEITFRAGFKARPPYWKKQKLFYLAIQSELVYSLIHYKGAFIDRSELREELTQRKLKMHTVGISLNPSVDIAVSENIHFNIAMSLLIGPAFSKRTDQSIDNPADKAVIRKTKDIVVRGVPLILSAAIAW